MRQMILSVSELCDYSRAGGPTDDTNSSLVVLRAKLKESRPPIPTGNRETAADIRGKNKRGT